LLISQALRKQGFFYCPKKSKQEEKRMAEKNENEILNGAETSQEEKTPDENLSAPGEQPRQTETPLTEQPQVETPGQEKSDDIPPREPPAPDIADTPPAPEADKQAAKEAEKQAAEQDKGEQDAPTKQRRGRQPTTFNPKVEHQTVKSEKQPQAEKSEKEKPDKPKRGEKPPKAPKGKQAASVGGGGIGGASGQTPAKEDAPPVPTMPPVPEPPRDANRINETETIVYIDHSELHPFKNHPFQVRDDDAMKTLVTSVKERGVDQPAIVRPREEGGYEIVAGHRRQQASEMAGIKNIPCVVRNMTDDEAILAMTESNFNQRSEILASERAQALKMQLEAIKRQGERFKGVATGDVGKRSNEIIAERNKMGAKTVQRYIALNNLVPDLMKLADDKKIPFMTAFEMSYIKPKNQDYIAMTIDAQESAPSLAQAQRMRELDSKGVLNGDVIDGIMLEEKKEEIKVIINSQELGKYFGADKSPKEMKDTILKLLDEYKEKQPPELTKPDKKKEQEK